MIFSRRAIKVCFAVTMGVAFFVAVLVACTSEPTQPPSVSPLPIPDEQTVIPLPNVTDDGDFVIFSMLLFWDDSVTGEPGYEHRIVAEIPVASVWAEGRVKDAQGNIVSEWEFDTGILPYIVSNWQVSRFRYWRAKEWSTAFAPIFINDDPGPGSGQYGDPILFVIDKSDYAWEAEFTVSGRLYWRIEGEGDLACIPDSATVLDEDGWSILGTFNGTQPLQHQVYMPLIFFVSK